MTGTGRVSCRATNLGSGVSAARTTCPPPSTGGRLPSSAAGSRPLGEHEQQADEGENGSNDDQRAGHAVIEPRTSGRPRARRPRPSACCLRKQLEDEKEQRRIELRWSARRQAIGTFCVVVGLGLTTWGSLLALSVGTTTQTTTVTATTMTTTTTTVTAATPTATHRADVHHPARHIHSPQARG
jgi:hypothetical protein